MHHRDNVYVLQRDIDLLVATGVAWGLGMNADKCVVLRLGPWSSNPNVTGDSAYKVNDCNIKIAQTHSNLRVLVDPNLKFQVYVRRVAAAVAGRTAKVLGCTQCRDWFFKEPLCHPCPPEIRVWMLVVECWLCGIYEVVWVYSEKVDTCH